MEKKIERLSTERKKKDSEKNIDKNADFKAQVIQLHNESNSHSINLKKQK